MQRTGASKLPEQSRNNRALSSKLALWNNLASAFSDWTTGNDYLLQTKSQGSRDIQGALGVAGAFAERGAWLHGRRVLGVEGVWGWLFRRALRPEGVLWVSGVAGDPGRLEKKEGTPWRGPGLRRKTPPQRFETMVFRNSKPWFSKIQAPPADLPRSRDPGF